jgi:hypothetical protein
VPASQSGQRVTLPQCLSGTQASSLSDWPRQSGRRESNTLHRVGGPRSDHQTAPASGAPRRYRAGPTSLQRTAGPWPKEQRAACRSRTGARRLTEARCPPWRCGQSGVAESRTRTPSVRATKVTFHTTPHQRPDSNRAPSFWRRRCAQRSLAFAPRRGIEPLSLGRQPSCDPSRITRHGKPLRRESNADRAP